MCDGRSVVTLEGLRIDPTMELLRRHFHECHALQCGFCTPGMLIMARDILQRLPQPDAQTVRHELSGQICRCTGYANIVKAIVAAGQETGVRPHAGASSGCGTGGIGRDGGYCGSIAQFLAERAPFVLLPPDELRGALGRSGPLGRAAQSRTAASGCPDP